MKRKYWVLSPNVMNGADETEWKNAISNLKRAFIGYDDHICLYQRGNEL